MNEIADGRSPKKVANDKIAFYQIKKRELGSDLAQYNKNFSRRNSSNKRANQMAMTPGAFFHQRHHRNLSHHTTVSFSSGQPQQALFNSTQQPMVTNKAFGNYLSVRERAVENAREHIEKQNKAALQKIKKEKLAAKHLKDAKLDSIDRFEKHAERVATKKRFKDMRNRELIQAAMDSYKEH